MRGVLLINLGTPDRCNVPSVRKYLGELLSDPSMIRLPVGLRRFNTVLGRAIARVRAPSSTKMYKRIWTGRGSPLKAIVKDQAAALRKTLPRGWEVFCAMRYGEPSIPGTLREIEAAGARELVIIPMYPQFSEPTTGTALRQVYDYLKGADSRIHVAVRTSWHDDRGYVNAQAQLIERYARDNGLTPDNAYLLFSAHGLLMSCVKRDDPYPEQVTKTAGLVRDRLDWPPDRTSLAYQSRVGPAKWLGPYTNDTLRKLVGSGETRVLVCPISFTADCVETLDEIDIRYRALLEGAGAELYLCPTLNTFGPFISALKGLVLRGPCPAASGGLRPARRVNRRGAGDPRLSEAAPNNGGAGVLVMVGVSMRGRLGAGRGPELAYTDERGLRSVKRSQCEVPPLLRTLQERTRLHEAWLLNTCRRFELYGWVASEDRTSTTARIKRLLLEDGSNPTAKDSPHAATVLYGSDARHHLLRTAAGLNSELPGERDVLDQLQAACRLADRAGTAGPLTRRLLDDVLQSERRLRRDTPWGLYAPDYCHVALARIAETAGLDFPVSSVVVIGGSTTSAGVLRTLRERFDVPGPRLTLLHRGHKHGGHLKVLRKAIGNGRRIRVQSYDERRVLHIIAESDVVVFGVDREEPVLDTGMVRTLRNWRERPLTIVDFNTFRSTTGANDLEGVTLYDARHLETEVAKFADEMCATRGFTDAVNAAEAWITRQVVARGSKPCDAPALPVTMRLETECTPPGLPDLKCNGPRRAGDNPLSRCTAMEGGLW